MAGGSPLPGKTTWGGQVRGKPLHLTTPCCLYYDGQSQTSVAYDSSSESAFGHDALSVLATGEKKNGTTGDRVLFAKFGEFLAAKTAPKLLGPGTQFGAKIEGQLAKRGWTEDLVQSSIDKPTRTVPWSDTRHLPGGGRMNDPATASTVSEADTW